MKLSVCVITYNHEAFIEQALSSVLQQDVDFEYEVVVGEDCSTDSTSQLLTKIERDNPYRMRVIYRRPNIGGRANLYKTLAACRGKYVAFLEGDDFWSSSKKLQLQVDFLDNHANASCVFHRTRVLNASDPSSEGVVPVVDPPEFSSFDFVLQARNPIAASALVARRACFEDIHIWLADFKPGDWPMCMMLAKKGAIGFIPLEMSSYRVHPAGYWTRLSPFDRYAQTIRMFRHVSGLVSGADKERVESRLSEFTRWCSSELINNPSLSIEAAMDDLNRIGDCQLACHFLADVAKVARADVRQPELPRKLLGRLANSTRKRAEFLRKTILGASQ